MLELLFLGIFGGVAFSLLETMMEIVFLLDAFMMQIEILLDAVMQIVFWALAIVSAIALMNIIVLIVWIGRYLKNRQPQNKLNSDDVPSTTARNESGEEPSPVRTTLFDTTTESALSREIEYLDVMMPPSQNNDNQIVREEAKYDMDERPPPENPDYHPEDNRRWLTPQPSASAPKEPDSTDTPHPHLKYAADWITIGVTFLCFMVLFSSMIDGQGSKQHRGVHPPSAFNPSFNSTTGTRYDTSYGTREMTSIPSDEPSWLAYLNSDFDYDYYWNYFSQSTLGDVVDSMIEVFWDDRVRVLLGTSGHYPEGSYCE